MSQKTNLNVSPYFDDYLEDKNYYKILFRPGYAIQTRELTSLQSILQSQIESHGKYQFKQGDLVIPGEVGLNTKVNFVKLSSVSEVAVSEGDKIVFKKYDIKKLVGQTIQGITSGVTALVLEVEYATDISADTLYIEYLNSGNSGEEFTFRQGETLEVVDGVNTPLLIVGTDKSVLPTSIEILDPDTGDLSFLESPAMGYASGVKVQEGIYFVNGFFVKNDEQLIIVDKYYDKPSIKVGFDVVEEIVTPEQDSSLYDNSRGYSNFSSPGAHRLKISLKLRKYGINDITGKNFIQLITVKTGIVQKIIKRADYSLIESTLARRTFDESGDYVVKDFPIEVREYYQRNNNLGFYPKNLETDLVNNLLPEEASRKMIASIGPGKAYVRGYEIVNDETKYLEINKASDTLVRDNVTIKSRGLTEFKVTNVYGTVPLSDAGADVTSYPTIYLNSIFTDGSIGTNGLLSSNTNKKTIDRRGQKFEVGYGIKTVYIDVTNSVFPLGFLTDENFDTFLDTLWFIKTRDFGQVSTVDFVNPIAYSKVTRTEFGFGAQFLELTIYGKTDLLETYFKDYDEFGASKFRSVFLSQSDALANDNEYGRVIDYSKTITPVIGVAKPKNISFIADGEGFNPDTDIVISKGKLTDGSVAYNATFGFNYFNPVFFTKLSLDSISPENNFINQKFSAGKYVTGTQSGAYGVIEGASNLAYSSDNILFVKTLSGTFVPNETIFDEVGNTLKIAQENTISHFIVVNRGLNYVNPKISIDGIVFDSSKILVRTEGSSIYRIEILDRSFVSTQYSQPPTITIVSESTPAVDAKVIPVMYRNTVLTYTPESIKSFSCEYGSANSNKFTADVQVNETKFYNSKIITQFTFSGVAGNKYIECNGFDGNAAKDLKQGDLILFTDDEGVTVRSIVEYATEPNGPKKSRIYLAYTLRNDVTNVSVIKIFPQVENNDNSTLVFPTGANQIKSLIKDFADSKFKYYARKDFITEGASSGGIITFVAQLEFGTQRFVNYTKENFLVTVIDKGSSTTVKNGDVLYIDPRYIVLQSPSTEGGLVAGSVTLNLPQNFFGNIQSNFPKLKLSTTIEVTKAKPKLKTVVKNKRLVVISSGDKVIPLRGKDYDTEEIDIFSYSDAFKLNYVYEGSLTNPPLVDTNGNLISGGDVTNRFTFDDGQRDTLYDVSRLVLKPGFEAPVGQLVISFDYFEHSGGDFCTVDSYLHEAGVGPEEIPMFSSAVYGNISLRDVIDFRPKADSTTIISGFQDRSILGQTNYINFSGPSGAVSSTPAPDNNLEFTFSFSETQYLDRIDGIFLDKDGKFVVKEGNSSIAPAKPENIDDAIALYYVYVPSFTNTSKDVRITTVDNRRYTMRDIGKLEKRIERLEYYTTLSILEQQALNMQIKDEIGLDRFKSGFIVDNFETHGIGNIKSVDYKCSIDTQQSILRPQVKEDSFKLREVFTRNDERQNAGYQKTGDVITLPYKNIKLLGNDYATKTINPNPFVVLQYVGDLTISPTVDRWYNTDIVPLISDNNTQLFDVFLSKEDLKDSFSSFYNSFIINWIGVDKVFFNITSFSQINTDESSSTVRMASVASSSNISPDNNETAKGVTNKKAGNNSVVSSIHYFTRTIPVKFKITRLKPKTQVYPFIDGINISRWTNPDSNYTGISGNSSTTFNSPIITDDNGNASGIIIIPAGKAPLENTSWTNNVQTVSYDDSSADLYFPSGVKTIRFTSSSSDITKNDVETFAESKFYSVGTFPENPSGIISTMPAYFKANEGVQLVDNVTSNKERPNPLSQTFKVENFEGGVFVTGLDLFFKNKSKTIPLRVYLSNVDTGKPGKYIVPGTETTLLPSTYLKVYTNGTLTLKIGEKISGKSSGASGPIEKVIDKNNNILTPSNVGEVVLNNDQVYTLVLSNHDGVSFIQTELLEIPSLTQFNNTTAQNLTVTIAKDSGKIVDLIIRNVGQLYTGAVITIESPQLPGGSTASGTVNVSGGRIYNTNLVLPGSGYTEPPSVVIRGTGSGSSGAVIESIIEIDTPAVRMGISVDGDGATPSVTPTKFSFEHPVYLQNDTEYAMCVETDSPEYEMWASRLTETEITSGISITTQPLLGSVYKSQNIDNWTEDLFEDIKFTLYRAEFDIIRPANLLLTNENLGYEKLGSSAVQTYALANSNATSPLFKNNNSVIKINHRDNGFEDSGKSYVFFRGIENIGGFAGSVLNNTLFRVQNSGVDYYNLVAPTRAGSNSLGGGEKAYASYNRKYERLFAHINYIQPPQTNINTFVKTTNVVPVDSNTTNYISYSQPTEFEKTFLNEEHFFLNQKILCSRINEIMNSIDRSLTYRVNLSSAKSYLSPVIDLRIASIKTSTNRVENAIGQENRFGKRYQIIKFLPIYTLQVSGNGNVGITVNQTVQGEFSGARGTIVKSEAGKIWVKLLTPSSFVPNEFLFFSTQSQEGANLDGVNVSIVSGGINELTTDFQVGTTVVAFNPSNTNQKYDNIISGRIIKWDNISKELIIENDKAPINGDYVSRITVGSAFSRNPSISNQVPDIFRVGDIVFYNNILAGEAQFNEIGNMKFSNGVDYYPEISSKNSSALAKYVTKEVVINNSGTSIDARITANIADTKNIQVLYKFKELSTQSNFDDLDWYFFNNEGEPDINVLASYSNNISPQFDSQKSYQELKYSVANLPEFTSFAIKIIMKTSDPVYVPKIQDLRAVASY
jgi:hypothetical protein